MSPLPPLNRRNKMKKFFDEHPNFRKVVGGLIVLSPLLLTLWLILHLTQ